MESYIYILRNSMLTDICKVRMASKNPHQRALEITQSAGVIGRWSLHKDFEIHHENVGLPLEERFGASMVVALRAWEFGLFRELRRNPDAKPF